MSSNPPPAASSSKAAAPSAPQSPAQNQSTSATVNFFGQQRGSVPFKNAPTPRNNQPAKKQNKASKKFRQSDEDSIAESVSATRADVFCADSLARHASVQQPEGADVHNTSHELQPPTSPTEPPPLAWPRQGLSTRSHLGRWLRLSCERQSEVRHAPLGCEASPHSTDMMQIRTRKLPLHCRSAW